MMVVIAKRRGAAEQNNDVHVTILKTEEKTGFQNLRHKMA